MPIIDAKLLRRCKKFSRRWREGDLTQSQAESCTKTACSSLTPFFSFPSVVFNFPTTTVGNHHLVSMQDGHLIPARQLSSPGWTPQSGAVSSTQVRRTLIGQLLRCLASSDWSLIKRSLIGQLLTCLASSDWSLVFWCGRHHIDG